MMNAANDTRPVDYTKSIRPARTAVATMRRALKAGNVKTARNAARQAWPVLDMRIPMPKSDDLDVWANVLRVLEARVNEHETSALRLRQMLAR